MDEATPNLDMMASVVLAYIIEQMGGVIEVDTANVMQFIAGADKSIAMSSDGETLILEVVEVPVADRV